MAAFVFCVGTAVQTGVSNVIGLVIGRVVAGLGVGLVSMMVRFAPFNHFHNSSFSSCFVSIVLDSKLTCFLWLDSYVPGTPCDRDGLPIC